MVGPSEQERRNNPTEVLGQQPPVQTTLPRIFAGDRRALEAALAQVNLAAGEMSVFAAFVDGRTISLTEVRSTCNHTFARLSAVPVIAHRLADEIHTITDLLVRAEAASGSARQDILTTIGSASFALGSVATIEVRVLLNGFPAHLGQADRDRFFDGLERTVQEVSSGNSSSSVAASNVLRFAGLYADNCDLLASSNLPAHLRQRADALRTDAFAYVCDTSAARGDSRRLDNFSASLYSFNHDLGVFFSGSLLSAVAARIDSDIAQNIVALAMREQYLRIRDVAMNLSRALTEDPANSRHLREVAVLVQNYEEISGHDALSISDDASGITASALSHSGLAGSHYSVGSAAWFGSAALTLLHSSSPTRLGSARLAVTVADLLDQGVTIPADVMRQAISIAQGARVSRNTFEQFSYVLEALYVDHQLAPLERQLARSPRNSLPARLRTADATIRQRLLDGDFEGSRRLLSMVLHYFSAISGVVGSFTGRSQMESGLDMELRGENGAPEQFSLGLRMRSLSATADALAARLERVSGDLAPLRRAVSAVLATVGTLCTSTNPNDHLRSEKTLQMLSVILGLVDTHGQQRNGQIVSLNGIDLSGAVRIIGEMASATTPATQASVQDRFAAELTLRLNQFNAVSAASLTARVSSLHGPVRQTFDGVLDRVRIITADTSDPASALSRAMFVALLLNRSLESVGVLTGRVTLPPAVSTRLLASLSVLSQSDPTSFAPGSSSALSAVDSSLASSRAVAAMILHARQTIDRFEGRLAFAGASVPGVVSVQTTTGSGATRSETFYLTDTTTDHSHPDNIFRYDLQHPPSASDAAAFGVTDLSNGFIRGLLIRLNAAAQSGDIADFNRIAQALDQRLQSNINGILADRSEASVRDSFRTWFTSADAAYRSATGLARNSLGQLLSGHFGSYGSARTDFEADPVAFVRTRALDRSEEERHDYSYIVASRIGGGGSGGSGPSGGGIVPPSMTRTRTQTLNERVTVPAIPEETVPRELGEAFLALDRRRIQIEQALREVSPSSDQSALVTLGNDISQYTAQVAIFRNALLSYRATHNLHAQVEQDIQAVRTGRGDVTAQTLDHLTYARGRLENASAALLTVFHELARPAVSAQECARMSDLAVNYYAEAVNNLDSALIVHRIRVGPTTIPGVRYGEAGPNVSLARVSELELNEEYHSSAHTQYRQQQIDAFRSLATGSIFASLPADQTSSAAELRTRFDNVSRVEQLSNLRHAAIFGLNAYGSRVDASAQARLFTFQDSALTAIDAGNVAQANRVIHQSLEYVQHAQFASTVTTTLLATAISFVPIWGMWVGSTMFASMALEQVATEYRATGTISASGLMMAGLAFVPPVLSTVARTSILALRVLVADETISEAAFTARALRLVRTAQLARTAEAGFGLAMSGNGIISGASAWAAGDRSSAVFDFGMAIFPLAVHVGGRIARRAPGASPVSEPVVEPGTEQNLQLSFDALRNATPANDNMIPEPEPTPTGPRGRPAPAAFTIPTPADAFNLVLDLFGATASSRTNIEARMAGLDPRVRQLFTALATADRSTAASMLAQLGVSPTDSAIVMRAVAEAADGLAQHNIRMGMRQVHPILRSLMEQVSGPRSTEPQQQVLAMTSTGEGGSLTVAGPRFGPVDLLNGGQPVMMAEPTGGSGVPGDASGGTPVPVNAGNPTGAPRPGWRARVRGVFNREGTATATGANREGALPTTEAMTALNEEGLVRLGERTATVNPENQTHVLDMMRALYARWTAASPHVAGRRFSGLIATDPNYLALERLALTNVGYDLLHNADSHGADAGTLRTIRDFIGSQRGGFEAWRTQRQSDPVWAPDNTHLQTLLTALARSVPAGTDIFGRVESVLGLNLTSPDARTVAARNRAGLALHLATALPTDGGLTVLTTEQSAANARLQTVLSGVVTGTSGQSITTFNPAGLTAEQVTLANRLVAIARENNSSISAAMRRPEFADAARAAYPDAFASNPNLLPEALSGRPTPTGRNQPTPPPNPLLPVVRLVTPPSGSTGFSTATFTPSARETSVLNVLNNVVRREIGRGQTAEAALATALSSPEFRVAVSEDANFGAELQRRPNLITEAAAARNSNVTVPDNPLVNVIRAYQNALTASTEVAPVVERLRLLAQRPGSVTSDSSFRIGQVPGFLGRLWSWFPVVPGVPLEYTAAWTVGRGLVRYAVPAVWNRSALGRGVARLIGRFEGDREGWLARHGVSRYPEVGSLDPLATGRFWAQFALEAVALSLGVLNATNYSPHIPFTNVPLNIRTYLRENHLDTLVAASYAETAGRPGDLSDIVLSRDNAHFVLDPEIGFFGGVHVRPREQRTSQVDNYYDELVRRMNVLPLEGPNAAVLFPTSADRVQEILGGGTDDSRNTTINIYRRSEAANQYLDIGRSVLANGNLDRVNRLFLPALGNLANYEANHMVDLVAHRDPVPTEAERRAIANLRELLSLSSDVPDRRVIHLARVQLARLLGYHGTDAYTNHVNPVIEFANQAVSHYVRGSVNGRAQPLNLVDVFNIHETVMRQNGLLYTHAEMMVETFFRRCGITDTRELVELTHHFAYRPETFAYLWDSVMHGRLPISSVSDAAHAIKTRESEFTPVISTYRATVVTERANATAVDSLETRLATARATFNTAMSAVLSDTTRTQRVATLTNPVNSNTFLHAMDLRASTDATFRTEVFLPLLNTYSHDANAMARLNFFPIASTERLFGTNAQITDLARQIADPTTDLAALGRSIRAPEPIPSSLPTTLEQHFINTMGRRVVIAPAILTDMGLSYADSALALFAVTFSQLTPGAPAGLIPWIQENRATIAASMREYNATHRPPASLAGLLRAISLGSEFRTFTALPTPNLLFSGPSSPTQTPDAGTSQRSNNSPNILNSYPLRYDFIDNGWWTNRTAVAPVAQTATPPNVPANATRPPYRDLLPHGDPRNLTGPDGQPLIEPAFQIEVLPAVNGGIPPIRVPNPPNRENLLLRDYYSSHINDDFIAHTVPPAVRNTVADVVRIALENHQVTVANSVSPQDMQQVCSFIVRNRSIFSRFDAPTQQFLRDSAVPGASIDFGRFKAVCDQLNSASLSGLLSTFVPAHRTLIVGVSGSSPTHHAYPTTLSAEQLRSLYAIIFEQARMQALGRPTMATFAGCGITGVAQGDSTHITFNISADSTEPSYVNFASFVREALRNILNPVPR